MRWPLWRVAVVEQSMEPGLRPGDWLLVRRTTRPARRGRSRPGRRTRIRLGGTARIRLGGTARIRLGGTARIRPGQVVIARHPDRPDMLLVKRAVRQESGGWWLDSDNPDAGAVDSRRFGPVPPELIEGLVLLRYRRARRASR
jgi:signal peptidase I